MRSVLWVMLSLAGCQFQVASAGGSPDLAPAGIASGAPESSGAAADLASPLAASVDLMRPEGPTPIVAMDMAPIARASAVGAACKTSAECGGDGLVCVDQVGIGKTKVQFPGGHCTRDCTTNACPSDSMCAREGGTFNLCEAKCTPGVATGCRDGYRCCSADAVCAPANSCT